MCMCIVKTKILKAKSTFLTKKYVATYVAFSSSIKIENFTVHKSWIDKSYLVKIFKLFTTREL